MRNPKFLKEGEYQHQRLETIATSLWMSHSTRLYIYHLYTTTQTKNQDKVPQPQTHTDLKNCPQSMSTSWTCVARCMSHRYIVNCERAFSITPPQYDSCSTWLNCGWRQVSFVLLLILGLGLLSLAKVLIQGTFDRCTFALKLWTNFEN